MNSGIISIIVTCYNQEYSIQTTLKSVLSQTYANWECIIIDDGSTDDSAKVIKQFIKEDERFSYIYQDNTGVSKARNTGFTLAKGDYINFLDGDDTFLPEKLEKQLQVFKKYPEIFICICDHQYFDEHKNTYAYYKFEPIKERPLEQLIYGWHNGVAFPPHAPLYKRSLWSLNEIPFPEDYTYRCEDWVFNVLVALKEKPYYWLEDILCNYHMATGNFTSDTKNLSKASIRAAYYLNPLIPKNYQIDFIDKTMDNAFKLILDSEKINILKSSGNWRVANAITKPLFNILKYARLKS
jgi:glycosyltransferase involved in cell wall biosynthesis